MNRDCLFPRSAGRYVFGRLIGREDGMIKTAGSIVSPAEVEMEMREEFQHHLAERTDALVRAGLAPEAADRQARREFGHQGTHRAQAREAMVLAQFTQLRFSWLDVKLGLRMLPKHPMLNLAAVFALWEGLSVGVLASIMLRFSNAFF